MYNPLEKKAKLSALRIMAGHTVGDIDSIGSLADLKNHEMGSMASSIPRTSEPMTTSKGFKESMTKKLRNMIKP